MSTPDTAIWEMIEAGGRTAQSFGLNRLLGQIYMLLYLSDEPQSLDDITEDLGVSKASVSIACRQLESWGALRKVWKRGDRKDYYRAETDFGTVLNNGLLASISKKLESAKTQIERSLTMLEDGDVDKARAEFLRARLQEADRYRAKVSGLLNNPLVKKIV